MVMKKIFFLAPLTLMAVGVSPLAAQTMPDAGRVLQEMAPAPEAPKASSAVPQYEGAGAALPAPGGAEVEIEDIHITGSSIFEEAELRKQIGPVKGKRYDYAALRGIADQLTNFYREAGYPFARVFLPPQVLDDGVLTLEIVEGRYGKITTEGPRELADPARAFLDGLRTGDVIESDGLERATLILDDLPDIKAAPVIRPGQETGSGDLNVVVAPTPMLTGEVGFDNNGNRYNGEYRGKLDLQLNGPLMLGDQLAIKALVSDENLWLGSVAYAAPLGASGLRGNVSYMQTDYQLGKQFKDLDATGYAKISSLGLSYPVLRLQRTNLSLLGSFAHKDLTDKQGSTASDNAKTSDSVTLAAAFDHRDGWLGGGVTYGQVGWTNGTLGLDEAALATDRTTARTDGSFNKLAFDVARLQALPQDLIFYVRLNGQQAFQNLDSSEGFGLGGPGGVRAYPVGEGYGDTGWLTQIELRYSYGAFSPFAFFDAGWVKINDTPWDDGKNERNLSGAGFGLRVYYEGLKIDAALAWKLQGGQAESDTLQRNPRAWVSVGYAF